MVRKAALIMAALCSSAEAQGQQFNLICTGESWDADIRQPFRLRSKEEKKPFSHVYRVDLDKGRWCVFDCKETKWLSAITETSIFFEREKSEDAHLEKTVTVNRETGHYVHRMQFDYTVFIDMGKCERAPFTGFPARKF